MALSITCRFAVALFSDDGRELGTIAAERDWELAHEWTRFYFQRRGELALNDSGDGRLVPVWDEALGEPHCTGYRVEIARSGRGPVACDFPASHFEELAKAAGALLVKRGKLLPGELYTYQVVAQPASREPEKSGGLRMVDASPAVPAGKASLCEYMARATLRGEIHAGDIPVFVPAAVLEQAATQTGMHQGTESGGILIGSLWQDKEAAEIFVEVTAQIPALHTAGSAVKLTFTPQTWTEAETARRLRRRNEIYLGYWHSHPVREWCREKQCSLEAQRNCRFARDFFSADDEAVLRAAFPRPWCVGIVANDTAFTELTFSMFANREGVIRPRGFYVLED